jgi:hypothetical protein
MQAAVSNNDRPPLPGSMPSMAVLSTWARALRDQSDIWSAAWSNVLSADYGPSHLIRDIAKSQQVHYEAARAILAGEAATAVGNGEPAWINIEIVASRFKPSELRCKAKTRRFDPFSDLETTSLAPISPSELRFKIEATSVSAEHILVEIVEAFDRAPDSSFRAIALEDALVSPRAQGSYLGKVMSAGAPLAVVNLVIRT